MPLPRPVPSPAHLTALLCHLGLFTQLGGKGLLCRRLFLWLSVVLWIKTEILNKGRLRSGPGKLDSRSLSKFPLFYFVHLHIHFSLLGKEKKMCVCSNNNMAKCTLSLFKMCFVYFFLNFSTFWGISGF